MSDLFRKEAIQHATRRLGGEVVLATPLPTRILTVLVLSTLAAASIFVSTATYARKQTVAGWLAPSGGVVRASTLRGGQIDFLAAQEGQIVEAGAPLARIQLASDLQNGNAGAGLMAALGQQAVAEQRSADAERARLESERVRLSTLIAGLDSELDDLRRQRRLQTEQVELAEQQLTRSQAVAQRGYLSARDLDGRRSAFLSAQQDLASLERAISGVARQRADAEAQLGAIPVHLAAADADAAAARAALDERTTATEAQSAYIVNSPIRARIAAVPVRQGQTLGAGETIAVLIPDDEEIIAELYIPTRAAGFIREGQEVRLLYEAFPHQRFGPGVGEIRRISRTVLAPAEISIPGLTLQEPVFRVEAALERQAVDAYGESIPLQPGMLLSADIVIDRRTLIEWLFDPIFAAGRR